jgi:hypothetical protein
MLSSGLQRCDRRVAEVAEDIVAEASQVIPAGQPSMLAPAVLRVPHGDLIR